MWLRYLILLSAIAFAAPGCAIMQTAPPGNPLFVNGDNDEVLWERTVDVVHDYFEIARENKLNGVIETEPKVSASLFEPWHHDTVGFRNKLEGTFQSIRRRAIINIQRQPGGYLIAVEVLKELEDSPGLAANTPASGSFLTNNPIQRDTSLVEGQATPDGWINAGRDAALEQRMLAAIYRRLSQP